MPPRKTKAAEAKVTEANAVEQKEEEEVKKKTKKTTKARAPAKTKAAAKKKNAEEEPAPAQEVENAEATLVEEHVEEPQVAGEGDVQEVQTEVDVEQEGVSEDANVTEEVKEEIISEEDKEEEGEEKPAQEESKPPLEEDKINAHRIFITRIAFEATKDDLEEYFNKFGTVHDAYCPRQHSNTNLNKGFGFISFDNEESIQKVFDTAPHIIMGREVIVDRATGQKHHSSMKRGAHGRQHRDHHEGARYKRFNDGGYNDRPDKFYKRHSNDRPGYTNEVRDSYNQSLPPYRQQNVTGGNFDPNKPVSYVFSGSGQHDKTNDASGGRTVSSRNQRERAAPKLFIGRISFDTTVQSLRAYFSQFGEVVDAYIPRDSYTQRSKGFGFLTFANKNSIHAVLEPNIKHTLDGRELIIDYADVSNRRV